MKEPPGTHHFTLAAAALLCLSLYSKGLTQQSEHRQASFTELDKNSDGRLSSEELPYKNLFRRLDINGDGFVSEKKALAIRNSHRTGETESPIATPGKASPSGARTHGAAAKKAALNPDTLAKLDLAMERAIADQEVSGIVGLIHRNGVRGYFESFGWQEIETEKPMPLDAIFRLQSMSKPIVTVAALVLFESGKFDLDEPISNYLPEWKNPTVLESGKVVPSKTQITPRMLMTHSSGLYYGSLPGHPLPRGRAENLEAHSKTLASRPLKFHPGENYSYGTSIDVLGRYCEAISGKPLDEVVKELVLAPLKMVDTDFWVHPDKADRIAQLYGQIEPGKLKRGREASLLTIEPTMFLGGQGLCGTAEDYERFCLMLLNNGKHEGVRILQPETVDLIFTNHLEGIGKQYGLGGVVDGEGSYAWGGANGTKFSINRPENMISIFMVQTHRYRAPTFQAFQNFSKEAVAP